MSLIEEIANSGSVEELHQLMSLYNYADPRQLNNLFSNNLTLLKDYYTRIITDLNSPNDRHNRIEKLLFYLKAQVSVVNTEELVNNYKALSSTVESIQLSVDASGKIPAMQSDIDNLKIALDNLGTTISNLTLGGGLSENALAAIDAIQSTVTEALSALDRRYTDLARYVETSTGDISTRLRIIEDIVNPTPPPDPKPK